MSAWLPAGGTPRRWLLLVPPFAEEMNKSRRMLALLGRRMADAGWGAVLVDLGGTGDSWGDFRDARYELWLSDLRAAAHWAEARGGRVTAVLGLRFGALLAAQVARDLPAVERLVFWQPALSGADVLGQFLRLRMAASLVGKGEAPDRSAATETSAGLRARLEAGESLEVAGYELSPVLYRSVNQLRLETCLPDRPLDIDWFHLGSGPEPSVPEAIAKAAATLTTAETRVRVRVARGDGFWATSEITTSEELLDLTAVGLLS